MPRTLAQNAQYIAETIKPAIKSAIEAQGVTVPSTDSFLDYADRIGEIEGGGSGYQLKDLPTGSIATVNDAAELPLNALTVSVEAWQEGSGDPSPSNIRPIHGWDSGEITVCDDIDNPTQTKTYTQQFPQTIYGAEWDVVNGSFKVTETKKVLSNITGWQWYPQYDPTHLPSRYAVRVSDIQALDAVVMCSIFEPKSLADVTLDSDNVIYVAEGYINITYKTAESINDFLTTISNQTATFKLATPTTIDLSPLSIRLLEGTNNIYADCGEVIEGEYFVDEGAIDVRKVDYQIGSSGSIKTTDGRVLSGFASMSGYHARPLDASGNWLDVDWSKDFEIGSAFKVLAFPSGGNATIFGCGVSGSMNFAPNVYFWNGSTAYITLSENGSSSAVDTALNYTFQTDTWYFVRAKFTASTLNLKIEISTDMQNFTTVYNDTLAAAPYHDAASICIGGMAQSVNYASNSILIDTFNTYIKGDGVNWGAFTGVFPS